MSIKDIDKNDEIDLIQFIKTLIKYWPSIISLVIFCTLIASTYSFTIPLSFTSSSGIEIGKYSMPSLNCEDNSITGVTCKTIPTAMTVVEKNSELQKILISKFKNNDTISDFKFLRSGGDSNMFISVTSVDKTKSIDMINEIYDFIKLRHSLVLKQVVDNRENYLNYINSKYVSDQNELNEQIKNLEAKIKNLQASKNNLLIKQKNNISLNLNQLEISKEKLIQKIKSNNEDNLEILKKRYNSTLLQNNLKIIESELGLEKLLDEILFKNENIDLLLKRISTNSSFIKSNEEEVMDSLSMQKILQENNNYEKGIIDLTEDKNNIEYQIKEIEHELAKSKTISESIELIYLNLTDEKNNFLSAADKKYHSNNLSSIGITLNNKRNNQSNKLIIEKISGIDYEIENLNLKFGNNLDEQIYSLEYEIENLNFQKNSFEIKKNDIKFTILDNLKTEYESLLNESNYIDTEFTDVIRTSDPFRSNQSFIIFIGFFVGLLFAIIISIIRATREEFNKVTS